MAKIGKNTIDNLTTAMYEDSRIVYREYIQNAADAIDQAIKNELIDASDAQIDIQINANNREIVFVDNGPGIPRANFKTIMSSIGESTKTREENKGFRGIGRLGGISFCDKLVFSAKAKGEKTVSICTWDAKAVRDALADENDKRDAAHLVDDVTDYSEEICDNKNSHYFKVQMIDIENANSELLDVDNIKSYLQFVAPVPYKSGFIFRTKIKRFVEDNGFRLDEYQVFVNNDRLYKPYSTNIYKESNGSKEVVDEIKDIQFEVFRDSKDNPLAWMWFGISGFEMQIKSINEMRGIRLRKDNIQIGDEKTFLSHDFFDETRGGLYFVGEVHAVHSSLIPNARRDYFNLNDTCREFENKLKPLFFERFKQIYTHANDYKKSLQKTQDFIDSQREFDEKVKQGSFIDAEDKKKAEENLEKKRAAAEKATREISNREEKEGKDDVLGKVYGALKEKYKPETEEKTTSKKTETKEDGSKKQEPKKQYMAQQLHGYNKKEQKLVGKIYTIINMALAHDAATQLIQKIQEELMK